MPLPVHRLLGVLLLVTALTTAATARSQPTAETELPSFEEALEYADNAWVFGDYDVVVTVLRPRLLPTGPPAELRVLQRAYSRLASSAFFVDDRETAEAAVIRLLTLDPSYRLDPLVHPAQVLAFFESVRDAHPELAPRRPEPGATGDAIFVERSVREQSLLISMLPFGYGFYASEQDTWGTLYLLGQLSLATTSVAYWAVNERSRDGQGILVANGANVRRQRIHTGTGWAFVGLLVVNAVHGALAHQAQVEVGYRRLQEPPPEFAPASRARAWEFSFVPILGP
jgi:hypothetical protein